MSYQLIKDKPILFLDFDGVLNVEYGEKDEYGHTFHPFQISVLERLIEGLNEPYIVITSAWRNFGLKYIKELWKDRNLPGKILDITSYLEFESRGEEIDQWLKEHSVSNSYYIVDDVWDFSEEQRPHVHMCYGNHLHFGNVLGYGLTNPIADNIISAFKTFKSSQNELPY